MCHIYSEDCAKQRTGNNSTHCSQLCDSYLRKGRQECLYHLDAKSNQSLLFPCIRRVAADHSDDLICELLHDNVEILASRLLTFLRHSMHVWGRAGQILAVFFCFVPATTRSMMIASSIIHKMRRQPVYSCSLIRNVACHRMQNCQVVMSTRSWLILHA